MSSDPINLADDGAEPVWMGWYAGPRRADGADNRRLQLCQGQSVVTLSMGELARLVHSAGAWRPTPGSEERREPCT